MIKEIQLQYTVNNLVKLSREIYGDNAVEFLAARLSTVINENQLIVLIDSLKNDIK
jgi:hypothetical protein